MPDHPDLGNARPPPAVPHWHLGNLQPEMRRPEQEVEVPEGIELTEVRSTRLDPRVGLPAQRLGPAQRVAYAVTQQLGEEDAEGRVSQDVDVIQGVFVHRLSVQAPAVS